MTFKHFMFLTFVVFLAAGMACLIPVPQPPESPPAPEEPAPAPEPEEEPELEAPVPGVVLPGIPKSFTLNFQGAYLVYEPASGTFQITAEGNVLSYGMDWETKKVNPYLFHLRHRSWEDVFWQVNTNRREIVRIKGRTFGSALGGTSKPLPFAVDTVGGGGNTEVKRFLVRFPRSHMTYTPSTNVLKLVAENSVLSACGDWRRCKVHNNLFHFKQKEWDGFFWKVNTTSKKAWRVRNGAICERRPGGSEETLGIRVAVTR